jgi:hypothetical protein
MKLTRAVFRRNVTSFKRCSMLSARRSARYYLAKFNLIVLESKAATIVDLEHHRSKNQRKINDLLKQIVRGVSSAFAGHPMQTWLPSPHAPRCAAVSPRIG